MLHKAVPSSFIVLLYTKIFVEVMYIMEKLTLKVEGMSCEHCVKAVHNALAGIAGVTDIAVSLKDGTASFGYHPAVAPLETIKSAITEEGYGVTGNNTN
jgi:copper chaperone